MAEQSYGLNSRLVEIFIAGSHAIMRLSMRQESVVMQLTCKYTHLYYSNRHKVGPEIAE
jgi:hypothetical protein